MDYYRKLVKHLADEKSTDLIPNGGTDHAEVLIDNIFSHAKNSVRVFTGHLNSRVYGTDSVVSKAMDFLQSGPETKLSILIQEDLDSSFFAHHRLVRMCEDMFSDRCEVKMVAEEDRKHQKHFVTMDDSGYRVEPDKEKPAGIGCFNDSETATKLNENFDDMFSRGQLLTTGKVVEATSC